MRANQVLLATFGALLCLEALVPAVYAANDLQSQYGTRHAYQTAAYSNVTRKRYQSLAAYAATVLEQQRQGVFISPRRSRTIAYRSTRRAYQTQNNHKSTAPENVGTRHAYQT